MAHVRFYAAARAATGVTQSDVNGQTLRELLENLRRIFPELGKVLPGCSFLLNGTSCKELSSPIETSDQIDVLPRFAGG